MSIIYPQDITGALRTDLVYRKVLNYLDKNNYYVDVIADDNTKTVIENVLQTIATNNDIIVYSNSETILNHLDNLLPVVYALSYKKSVQTHTIVELSNIFKEKNGFSEFDADPFDKIYAARLLVLSRVNSGNAMSSRYSGDYIDLLSHRRRKGYSTVATAFYSHSGKLTKPIVEQVESEIIYAVGAQTKDLLTAGYTLNFHRTIPKMSVASFEVA